MSSWLKKFTASGSAGKEAAAPPAESPIVHHNPVASGADVEAPSDSNPFGSRGSATAEKASNAITTSGPAATAAVTTPSAASVSPSTGPTTAVVAPAAAAAATTTSALEPQHEQSGYDRAAVRAQASAALMAVVVYWLAFLALNVYELQNDFRMLQRLRNVRWNKPVKQGPSGIGKERKFMWFVWGIHIFFCICFAIFACTFSVSRQFRSMRSGVQQAASRLRWLVWFCIIGAITTDWLKLYAIGSIVNKLMYDGQWCPGESVGKELDYTFNSAGGLKAVSPAPGKPGCTPHKATRLIRASVIAAVINLLVNTFLYFARGPKGLLTKVLSLIPAVLLTVLLYLKPLSSMMLLHYSQRKFIMKGNFNIQSETIVALISQVLALLFSLQMAYVISDLHLFSVTATRLFVACGCKGQAAAHDAAVIKATNAVEGKTVQSTQAAAPQQQVVTKDHSDAVTAAHPPRRPSLKMVYKMVVVQWFYTGQLPCVFGLLAPILVVALQHVWNFWVGLDLILGVAMFVAYALLFFTHKLLFPQWQSVTA